MLFFLLTEMYVHDTCFLASFLIFLQIKKGTLGSYLLENGH